MELLSLVTVWTKAGQVRENEDLEIEEEERP